MQQKIRDLVLIVVFFHDVRLTGTGRWIRTRSTELQVVSIYLEIVDSLHKCFDFMDAGITKFNYSST